MSTPSDAEKYQRAVDAIDEALAAVADLRPSRETSLVRTNLDEALLWLGLVAERPRPEPAE